jgi:Holliday junction resolvase
VIDFRYHLVSLVSVFLALAVGIVLGAGPLRESIGDTLLQQVNALRQEKDGLRADVATKNASIEHRDDFITAVAPELVGGDLADRSVAVVRLPGVEDTTVDSLVDLLGTAGATVTARVELTDAWTDPERRVLREQTAAQLLASVPGGVDGEDPQARLDALLARALLSGAPAGTTPVDEPARAVLAGLDGAGLLEPDGDVTSLADLALVLVPGVPEATGQQAQPTPAADTSQVYVQLARTLDAAGGTVVSGPASSATRGGLVDALRADDAAAREVSTIDTGGTPMGQVAAVRALRQQDDGGSGQYGAGDGATAPLPDTAAAS